MCSSDLQDFVELSFTPPACACTQPSARCGAVTYFEPTIPIPAAYVYSNRQGYARTFNGFELTARKRYANRWMLSASYAYNDAVDTFGSPAGFDGGTADQSRSPDLVDPTTVRAWSGGQYAIEAGGSGIDNVFVNAKWMAKVSGLYTLPWDINVGAFYNARQGYLMPQYILSPSRANRAGTVRIYLDAFGESRLPNFQTLDLKVDKTFRVKRLTLIPSVDIFNALNANTILARRLQQNSATANNISGIVAPRIVRFGVRATW